MKFLYMETMETEEERQARRRARLERMKREKRRAQLISRWVPVGGLIFFVVCVVCVVAAVRGSAPKQGHVRGRGEKIEYAPEGILPTQTLAKKKKDIDGMGTESEGDPNGKPKELFAAYSTMATKEFDEDIVSRYGIFIDAEEGEILAQRDAYERMNPASMTKILTLLVAAEHVKEEQFSDTVSITVDITDYCYINECSIAGYDLYDTATVIDLFYGTVLPSGADAALALAKYVAGSHEAFVELMNEKLEELGLSETTHFTNCVGLYAEDHYSTAYDMAMILKAASDNEFCREVLSAHTYTTAPTMGNPEGLQLSNWFLRRIEDRDIYGEVLCGKTGYVKESGHCAASLGVDRYGREYLCVTASSKGNQQCITDQVILYQSLLPEPKDTMAMKQNR